MKQSIMARSFLVVCVFVTYASAAQSTPNSESTNAATSLSLSEVVGEVVSNNSSIKAAAAKWEAMKERVPQARAWADPRIGFDQRAARFVGVPQNSFADERLMVEQVLPVASRN